MIFVAIVSCTLKMSISGGQPGGTVVKFAYFTSTALGSRVRILGMDPHTAHRAMLWQHPIQSRRRLAQVWAQGPSSSSKRKNMSISNHLLPPYRNTNDFRMLTLYPMTLLHSFMNSSSLFFVIFSRIFYADSHVICEKRQFYFFLSNLYAFYLIFLLFHTN